MLIGRSRNSLALYLRLGGLLGGWQDPQGLLAVTLFGVAFACPVNVNVAPAISVAAAILVATFPTLRYETAEDLARSIIDPFPMENQTSRGQRPNHDLDQCQHSHGTPTSSKTTQRAREFALN